MPQQARILKTFLNFNFDKLKYDSSNSRRIL